MDTNWLTAVFEVAVVAADVDYEVEQKHDGSDECNRREREREAPRDRPSREKEQTRTDRAGDEGVGGP